MSNAEKILGLEEVAVEDREYFIHESNMERLEKKLQRIANKCTKYGCNFHYEVIREDYKKAEDENGTEYNAKYFVVKAYGKAVVNGWRFIATVKHTEKGNLINKGGNYDVEVPQRYYNCEPFCEHCNSHRQRKDTYIVQNVESGEFKQVGKSCLCDYTHGMSAEMVASYIALFDELIKGEAVEGGYRAKPYLNRNEMLQYACECVKHFGYIKADDGYSTKERVIDYYNAKNGRTYSSKLREQTLAEMDEIGFNHESEHAVELAKNALEWLDTQSEDNNYMHNLKTVCAMEYIEYSHIGLLVSLIPTYNRTLVKKEERKEVVSEYVGEVGKRIKFEVASVVCVASWDSVYGVTRIYKFTDNDGHCFTWKTTNYVDDDVKTVTATVKAHTEYKGVKQTELTRCRVA